MEDFGHNEHVGIFHKKPIRFVYDVTINLNAHPRYHRTPVIRVMAVGLVYPFSIYSKIHFMNYLKYHKISIDSLPDNFVKAINNLCALPLFVAIRNCKYSRITVHL